MANRNTSLVLGELKGKTYLLIGAGEQMKAVILDIMMFGDPAHIGLADIDLTRAQSLRQWAREQRQEPCHVVCFSLDAFDKAAAVQAMTGFDVVINCAGNAMNPTLTAAAIEAGCHYVDIGQVEAIVAEQFKLHDAAVAAGSKVVPACGIAPGSQAMMVMDALKKLDPKDMSKVRIKVRCGGIPQHPKGPLKYRWAFSTPGLITEYLHPTAVIRAGKLKHRESMTGLEKQWVPGFGELEAAFTGGNTGTIIPTLLDRGFQGDFDYKTLRYRGHWQKMMFLKRIGALHVNEFVDRLEQHLLQYKDDPDALVLRVIVEDDQYVVTSDLIDRLDPATGLSAMQRTTGFSAAIVAQMLVNGTVKDAGVLRQELSIPLDVFFAEWRKRGLYVTTTRKTNVDALPPVEQ